MPDINDQHTAARPDDATRSELEESPLSIPAVSRFVAAVSEEVDEDLTAEVVEARLAKVRREALARARIGRADEQGLAQELARFGYTLVRLWLQVIRIAIQGTATIGRQDVGLDETEIHELAKDTTARAIASSRDEQSDLLAANDRSELKSAFLSECVRRLPEAYRSRHLELGQLGFELDEELGQTPAGNHLIMALRHCVTERREETMHLMRSWTESDEERSEIIELTYRALERAVRTYPEVRAGAVGSSDRDGGARS